MSDPFRHLQESTGKTMPEWFAVLEATGLERHSDLMTVLKGQFGVSHGFANGIALQFRSRGESSEASDLVDAQYSANKAALKPLYEALVAAATALGPDVEVAPKKTSVSLRRNRQFAVIEAASTKRIQLGLQLKGYPTTDRLAVGNAMCSHRVNLTRLDEIDDDLLLWLREAYDRA